MSARLSRPEVGARVKEILVRVLELDVSPEKIDDRDVIFEGDLEADSIASLEILTSIEDEFGFLFDDDEISADLFLSVGGLVDVVERKLAEGATPPTGVAGDDHEVGRAGATTARGH